MTGYVARALTSPQRKLRRVRKGHEKQRHMHRAEGTLRLPTSQLMLIKDEKADLGVNSIQWRLIMHIREMMHKGAEWVTAEATVVDVAKRMRDKDIGAVPVKDNGQLVGMITDRDIALRVVAASKDATKLRARDIMTTDVVTCREHENAGDAVRLMETKKVRRLPVLDDDRHLIGMISLGDVSQAMARSTCGEVLKAVSGHHA